MLQKRLKDLDFFKRLPSNVSKGSLLGVFLTLITILTVILLLINEVVGFMSKEVESSMRIDHRKDDQEVEVHLKIDLPYHPCHILGLDVTDYIGTHRVAEHKTLNYYTLDPNGQQLEQVNFDQPTPELKKAFRDALKKKMGCRIEGWFNILLVPGNFHISFHGQIPLYSQLLRELGDDYIPDLRHTIHHLYFGSAKNQAIKDSLMRDFNLKSVQTLTGYSSDTMVAQPGPFTFRYKLLIVPTDLIYEDGSQYDIFQYKTFWNVPAVEMGNDYTIWIEYELSSLSMVERRKHKYLSEFVVHICGIIGGLIAFMTFLHNLVQKSVVRLVYKHLLRKLD